MCTYDRVDQSPVDFLVSSHVMIVDTVRAAGINGAIFTCDVSPLTICCQDKLEGHAWNTTHPEGHCVDNFLVDTLLINVNQVVLYKITDQIRFNIEVKMMIGERKLSR